MADVNFGNISGALQRILVATVVMDFKYWTICNRVLPQKVTWLFPRTKSARGNRRAVDVRVGHLPLDGEYIKCFKWFVYIKCFKWFVYIKCFKWFVYIKCFKWFVYIKCFKLFVYNLNFVICISQPLYLILLDFWIFCPTPL